MDFNSTYALNDGNEIPVIGFGTWQMPNDDHTAEIVEYAIKNGYRHIDTAATYGNEESVGRGIKNSGVAREDLFVTTKLWNDSHGYDLAKKAIDDSLERMQLDYFDLYLIHWPNPKAVRDRWQEANSEAWLAMEEAQMEGKIMSIGVSNFMKRHLEALLETAKVTPAVNQILLNLSEMQPETVFIPGFEKAIQILNVDGSSTLILGNENYNKTKYSLIDSQGILCPLFSLTNQPMGNFRPVEFYLKQAKIDRSQKVGLVDWKLLSNDFNDFHSKSAMPSFIVEGLEKLVSKSQLINATQLYMDPKKGARVTNNANEIARYEYGASLASDSILNAMNALKEGVSEQEIGNLLQAD